MEVMVGPEESLLLFLSCVAFTAWRPEFCGEVEGHEIQIVRPLGILRNERYLIRIKFILGLLPRPLLSQSLSYHEISLAMK